MKRRDLILASATTLALTAQSASVKEVPQQSNVNLGENLHG